MKLKLAIDPDIVAMMAAEVAAGERAVTAAMREAGTGLKSAWRLQITGAGLGPRLQGRVSDRAIAERATARGLAPRALSSHAILPQPPQGLLLGYAGFDEDTLGHAGRTLGALLVSAPRG